MCTENCYRKPILYSTIYEDAYNSDDKNQWVKNIIVASNKCCIRNHIFTLELALKAVLTQSIFKNIEKDTLKKLKSSVENAKKQRIMRLRFIQKKTLNHMYKPKGSMFWRNLKNHVNDLTR